jgi:hypothetical protein
LLPANLIAIDVTLFVPINVPHPPPLLPSPLPSLSPLTKAVMRTDTHENDDANDIAEDGIFETLPQRQALQQCRIQWLCTKTSRMEDNAATSKK